MEEVIIRRIAALLCTLAVTVLASACSSGSPPTVPSQGALQELYAQQRARLVDCRRASGPWREVQVLQGEAEVVNKGERATWRIELQSGDARIRAEVEGEWVYWFAVISDEPTGDNKSGVLSMGPLGGSDCRTFTRAPGDYEVVVHDFGKGEWRGVLEERG